MSEAWDRVKGRFFSTDGRFSEGEPGQGAVFVIAAGPWPNPNIGCVQVRCGACNALCGLSPKGLGLHKANPARQITCPACFAGKGEMQGFMKAHLQCVAAGIAWEEAVSTLTAGLGRERKQVEEMLALAELVTGKELRR